DPEERYSSTRDLAKDLARLRDRLSDPVSRFGEKPARSRGGALVPWLIAVCLAVALAVTLRTSRSGMPRARPASFTIDVPPGTTYSSGEITTNMALAPDGRSIVLRVQEGNDAKLFLRRLDRVEALPIEGTQRAISPFWSPDSKFVGFFADAKLKKVPVEGGAVTTLCDAGPEGPGSWSARGTILFGQIQAVDPGIYAVSDTGGSPRLVTKSERPAVLLWPQWIDEGSKFLYLAVGLKTGHELRAFSLEKGDLGRVTGARILSRVELVAPNSLLYVQEGSLLAQRFDSRALRLEGEPLVLAQGVHYFWGPGNAGFSGSQTGIAAWEPYRPRSRIAVLDRQGRPVGPPGEVTEAVFSLRLSPDGTRLAYDLREPRFGTWDIWIRDLERGISTRLTTQPDDEKKAVWFPDGRRLLHRADYEGPPDVYEIGAGGGASRPIWKGPSVEGPTDISPDGTAALLLQSNRKNGDDVLLYPLTGDGKPVPLFHSEFEEQEAVFSSDGHWIAWDSDESGQREVYAVQRDEPATRVRLSAQGGRIARWRRDRRELFYVEGRRIMAVPLSWSPALRPGSAVELFRVGQRIIDYDVSADGSRFYVALEDPPPQTSRLRILLDWPALLAPGR
ncbi:MAG TPA: hypothetical protein VIB08_06895, partial [Thermoanaerobaculia bacterium]